MTARGGQRGQVLVEFAFAGLLFFTLLFAVIDFGRALYAYDQLAQAARVGARYASVNTPKNSDCGTAYASGGACQGGIIGYLAAKTGLDASSLAVNATTPTSGTNMCFGNSAVSDCPATAGTTVCVSMPSVGCAVTIDLKYQFHWILLPFATQTFSSTSSAVLTSQ